MEITQDKVVKLYQLYEELDTLTERSSNLIKEAKHNSGNPISVTRESGETVEVAESTLWDEIRYLGDKTEGFAVLQAKYPDAFSASDAVNKQLEEIQKYTIAELGIDALQLKLSDIMRVVEGIVEYKLNERKTATTGDEGDQEGS